MVSNSSENSTGFGEIPLDFHIEGASTTNQPGFTADFWNGGSQERSLKRWPTSFWEMKLQNWPSIAPKWRSSGMMWVSQVVASLGTQNHSPPKHTNDRTNVLWFADLGKATSFICSNMFHVFVHICYQRAQLTSAWSLEIPKENPPFRMPPMARFGATAALLFIFGRVQVGLLLGKSYGDAVWVPGHGSRSMHQSSCRLLEHG